MIFTFIVIVIACLLIYHIKKSLAIRANDIDDDMFRADKATGSPKPKRTGFPKPKI